MCLSIPEVFMMPVHYDEEDILNIRNTVTLKERNCDISFTYEPSNRKDIVIGVSLSTQREKFQIMNKETMETYAKDKGVKLKVEINDFDEVKQQSQVDDLISQGIDVLIMVPVNTENASGMIEKAHKSGIKVISYQRLAQNVDLDLFIAFNDIRVGELQGRFLTGKIPKGNYVIMFGDPQQGIKEGAMEYIQPLVYVGNIKIVADKGIKGWDPKIAFEIVKDALIANKNKINAILAPNDATAGAAIEALEEQDLAGNVGVTGMDADLAAIRRIIQGTQLMTVFKDTRELAKTAIDAAIELVIGEAVDVNATVNNGKIDVPSILLTPIAIDKTNIDSVLIDSGYLKKEDVYNR